MTDPRLGTVDPTDVFTADEYIGDVEGTYYEGKEIAFAEFSPEDDQGVYESDDIYEPDVFEYDDWGQLR